VREREIENHRKTVRELVPMSVLFPLLEMGLYDFEIADKLNVSEWLIREAKKLYSEMS